MRSEDAPSLPFERHLTRPLLACYYYNDIYDITQDTSQSISSTSTNTGVAGLLYAIDRQRVLSKY